MTAALEGGEWSAARPGRTLPPGKARCPLYRRVGGPQGRSGRAENLIPTGIRSRTVQPVVSLYTDRATGLTNNLIHLITKNKQCSYEELHIKITKAVIVITNTCTYGAICVHSTVMSLWKAVVYDCTMWEHESLGASNKFRRLPLYHIMAARNCKERTCILSIHP